MVQGEKPESISLSEGSDYHFIFLIDRSGSMTLERRMMIAKEALTLFIRSLSEGCDFTILNFGTDYSAEYQNIIRYNNDTKNNLIGLIDQFEANFGGTNIWSPLAAA